MKFEGRLCLIFLSSLCQNICIITIAHIEHNPKNNRSNRLEPYVSLLLSFEYKIGRLANTVQPAFFFAFAMRHRYSVSPFMNVSDRLTYFLTRFPTLSIFICSTLYKVKRWETIPISVDNLKEKWCHGRLWERALSSRAQNRSNHNKNFTMLTLICALSFIKFRPVDPNYLGL